MITRTELRATLNPTPTRAAPSAPALGAAPPALMDETRALG